MTLVSGKGTAATRRRTEIPKKNRGPTILPSRLRGPLPSRWSDKKASAGRSRVLLCLRWRLSESLFLSGFSFVACRFPLKTNGSRRSHVPVALRWYIFSLVEPKTTFSLDRFLRILHAVVSLVFCKFLVSPRNLLNVAFGVIFVFFGPYLLLCHGAWIGYEPQLARCRPASRFVGRKACCSFFAAVCSL